MTTTSSKAFRATDTLKPSNSSSARAAISRRAPSTRAGTGRARGSRTWSISRDRGLLRLMRRGQGPEFASGNTGQVVNEHLRSSRQQCAAFERPNANAQRFLAQLNPHKHWQIEVKPVQQAAQQPTVPVSERRRVQAPWRCDRIRARRHQRVSVRDVFRVARQGASGQARCSSPAAHNDDGCRRQAIGVEQVRLRGLRGIRPAFRRAALESTSRTRTRRGSRSSAN